MENQNNPPKDSTTPNDPKTPPTSPQHPPPPSGDASRSGEPKIMKTALEVLAELASSESSESHEGGGGNGGGSGSVASGGGGSSGGTTSLALAVGSGPMVAVQEPPSAGGEGRKKRKASDVKDPPSGTPTCPICFKEFSSWKGAFGHMRKHPDRQYRGFYKPPVSTPSPAARQLSVAADQGEGGSKNSAEGQSGVGRSSSPIRGLVFDLNQQPMDEAGSSNAAAEGNEALPAGEERIADEAQKGFDLNELPPDEDDA